MATSRPASAARSAGTGSRPVRARRTPGGPRRANRARVGRGRSLGRGVASQCGERSRRSCPDRGAPTGTPPRRRCGVSVRGSPRRLVGLSTENRPKRRGLSRQGDRDAWWRRGGSREVTVPPWAVDDRLDEREAEPGAAGRAVRGCGRRRRGRTARTRVLGQPGREAGAVVVHREARPGRRRPTTVTVVPGGVCLPGVGEQVGHHLVQPLRVAGDLDRLLGQVEPPAVVGADDPGVGDGLDAAAGRGPRRRAPSGRPESSRASSSRSSTIEVIRADSSSTLLERGPQRRRGVVGTPPRQLGVPARSWSAASAARGRRRPRTGAPAARCGAARSARSRRARAGC